MIKKRYLKPCLIFMIIIFLFSGYKVANNIYRLQKINNSLKTVNEEINEVEVNNEMLQDKLAKENKKQMIVEEAHKRGYIFNNEVVFYDVSGIISKK